MGRRSSICGIMLHHLVAVSLRQYGTVFMAGLVLTVTLVEAAVCSKCGTVSVPYPLSTGKSCGQPQYHVNCNAAKQLELPTKAGPRAILSIDALAGRMVISPATLTGPSCVSSDFASGGLSLDQSLPFNITSSNTIMLLNCTSILLRSPLNCSNNSPCREFAGKVAKVKACDTALCCSFEAGPTAAYNIPVNPQECSAYTSVVNFNPRVSSTSWEYGIEVQWEVPSEPSCGAKQTCEGMSKCVFDPASTIHKCICSPGYKWDSINGTCAPGSECAVRGANCGRKSNMMALIVGLVCGAVLLVLAYVAIALRFKRIRKKQLVESIRMKEFSDILSAHSGGKSAKVFTSKEVRKSTDGFSKDKILGVGGFGEVYKGTLADGTIVAVKTAKLGNVKGVDQVLNEVCILSQVNHRNLVRLLGCCVDMQQPLLIYEYVPNGNLFEHLQGTRGTFLTWKTRLNIAHQTAEGLAYLHSAAYPPIYHRDVKSSNILLDKSLNAKVSDFGLSKLASPDLTHVSTTAQGTLGYLDPEYYRNYQLTDKSDVYSFGVVLLELVSGQQAIDFTRDQDHVNLAVYALIKSENEDLIDIIEPRLLESAPPKIVETMIGVSLLALSCVQESRLDRPTMKEVVEELQFIIGIQGAESAEVVRKSNVDSTPMLLHT